MPPPIGIQGIVARRLQQAKPGNHQGVFKAAFVEIETVEADQYRRMVGRQRLCPEQVSLCLFVALVGETGQAQLGLGVRRQAATEQGVGEYRRLKRRHQPVALTVCCVHAGRP